MGMSPLMMAGKVCVFNKATELMKKVKPKKLQA